MQANYTGRPVGTLEWEAVRRKMEAQHDGDDDDDDDGLLDYAM